MRDVKEHDDQAFIGVAFNSKVIFSVLEHDVDFLKSGLSIIQHLKHDKNKFIARIIESQSYDSIKYIFDDEIIFSEFYDITNENSEPFTDVMNLVNNENEYHYFYIYDYDSDTLIIKIPDIPSVILIDYKDTSQVRDLINTIK